MAGVKSANAHLAITVKSSINVLNACRIPDDCFSVQVIVNINANVIAIVKLVRLNIELPKVSLYWKIEVGNIEAKAVVSMKTVDAKNAKNKAILKINTNENNFAFITILLQRFKKTVNFTVMYNIINIIMLYRE